MSRNLHHGFFVLRFRLLKRMAGIGRKLWYELLGMQIGKNTFIPKVFVTWPHQVSIGSNCNIENLVYFKFDGIWKKGPSIIIKNDVFIGSACEFNIRKQLIVGNDCLIASGCKFIDHDHGVSLHALMRAQEGPEKEINIGNNVWLGYNAVVLKGVTIEDGAIVAAGAVVTKSIPSNEIWAGIPAKKIGER